MMGGWNGGMGAAGWILMSGFWIVLVALVVWAVAALFPGRTVPGAAASTEHPEEILDRRLARGEIDTEAYDELRGRLRAARAERR